MSTSHSTMPAEQRISDEPIQERDDLDFQSKNSPPHVRAAEFLNEALEFASSSIAPVWPLKDFVAVNPWQGFSDRSFLKTRTLLQSVSNREMLMPVDYYQSRFLAGELDVRDIAEAVAEINDAYSPTQLHVSEIVDLLSKPVAAPTTEPVRQMKTVAEIADSMKPRAFNELITAEIGRHLAAYYDEGQAAWKNPHRSLPLYQAWKAGASIERSSEFSGLPGSRRLFANLPQDSQAAIAKILVELRVPPELWATFLICQALSMPGWGAWARYLEEQATESDQRSDFRDLLAIRMAYDLAVADSQGLVVDWNSMEKVRRSTSRVRRESELRDSLVRLTLLRASEIRFQRATLQELTLSHDSAHTETTLPLAQMVFCIDVRSEPLRRHIEGQAEHVRTFGFAGFFGVPIGIQSMDDDSLAPHLPALLSPQFRVRQGVRGATEQETGEIRRSRSWRRQMRRAWKEFQKSALGGFAFVETVGLLSGWKLIKRTSGRTSRNNHSHDGLSESQKDRFGPILDGLSEQGLSTEAQIEMTASILRGIGITSDFAPLVVLCGHSSRVENNPGQAGLDCGACCGHSGEMNARLVCAILNRPEIRKGLNDLGISIPDSTTFVPALHNTTNDQVTYFDRDILSKSSAKNLARLESATQAAGIATASERMPRLGAISSKQVNRRMSDWSEVRPEWGLAGNAAFIVAPRWMTRQTSQNGRSFLHSYDHHQDTDYSVLEQIMTAPLVVGHWINMQYYASTVDNRAYGSGSKTIHDVVGRFGLFSGNGGDLTTGLPWQCVHDGVSYQHEPLRLLAVIAAPRAAVHAIVQRHKLLGELVSNNWMHLVVVENGTSYRFKPSGNWEALNESEAPVAV